ncbi:hypothetical protein D3C87_1913690 [compost metagenome]
MSSPCAPPITGSPAITSKPAAGIAAEQEKALALIFWQPLQWQAMVIIGGAVIFTRTSPQRQEPSAGSFICGMAISSILGEGDSAGRL